MKILKRIYHAAAVAYIPCVLIVPAILNGILGGGGLLPDSYWLALLAVLMHSFPFWLSLIWLWAALSRFADRGEKSGHDKTVGKLSVFIDIASALAATATIIAGIFSVTVALGLSAVLCVLWIEDAIFTGRPLIDFAFYKDKAVWIIAAVLAVAVLAAAGICASYAQSRNVPDTVESNAAVAAPAYQTNL